MNALIEKESGKLIGHCGLLIQNVDKITELEIGYSLLPEFWNKGFATESAKKCRDYAFKNNLSNSILQLIRTRNATSDFGSDTMFVFKQTTQRYLNDDDGQFDYYTKSLFFDADVISNS